MNKNRVERRWNKHHEKHELKKQIEKEIEEERTRKNFMSGIQRRIFSKSSQESRLDVPF